MPLIVAGGDLVSGLELLVVVEDGGPALQAIDPSRSGLAGPAVTGVELLAGTLFEGLATDITPPDEPQFPQFQQRFAAVNDPPGGVVAAGTFAVLTFDTTGFFACESFGLSLSDPLFTSRFIDASSPTGAAVPLTLFDGTLNIVVPEPAAAAFAILPSALAACTRRRRRSAVDVE